MTPAELTTLLRRTPLPASREGLLQLAIEARLTELELDFEREAKLSPTCRIDFLIAGGIGLEAKTRYPKRGIWRQLERYARQEQITSLILVTGTAMGLPASIGEKPVFYVGIGRGCL